MKNDIATPGMCLSAGARFATKLGSIEASHELVDAFLKEGDDHPFYQVIQEYFSRKTAPCEQFSPLTAVMLVNWVGFYQKYFNIDLDVSTLRIPQKVEGFDRLIVIEKGLRLNQVWNTYKDLGIPTWQWWDGSLENAMQESERGAVKKSYAFWVRDGQEADEEMKNLSAEMIAVNPDKIDTESLIERLVHGLKFWDETKKHLDVSNITLCASSRFADGFVPRVFFYDVKVRVFRFVPSFCVPVLRARQAVR